MVKVGSVQGGCSEPVALLSARASQARQLYSMMVWSPCIANLGCSVVFQRVRRSVSCHFGTLNSQLVKPVCPCHCSGLDCQSHWSDSDSDTGLILEYDREKV